MPTIGDYSSVSEVGIAVNLAVTYINTFVEPSISTAERQISRFRWWVDDPKRLQKIRGKHLDVEDFEEALSEWSHEFDLMEASIKRHRKIPTRISLLSALVLCVTLFFHDLEICELGIALLGILAFVPVLGGAAYVWGRTRDVRRSERSAAFKANRLITG